MSYTVFPDTEKIDFSKKLNIKFGIDPTSDKLHLGHLVPLLLAKKLWREGHNIHIILGTFTAQLGDPSGKDTMRPILNTEDVQKNADSIAKQIHRFFGDYKEKPGGHVMISKNHVWFEEMGSMGMLKLLSKFTTTQLLSRDSFQNRIVDKNPIGMHELAVPVLQGYDSVQIKADIEIGGNDQMFNFGITRDVQRLNGQAPEICMLMPIINGTDGRKMSKSFDNCIFFNDTPEDVFGKTMSISDELMKEWWPILTDSEFPTDPKGYYHPDDMHPMRLKKDLAWAITKEIWSHDAAVKAEAHFESIIQKGNIPEEMISVAPGFVIDIVVELRKCSRTEAKKLMENGGVTVDGLKVLNIETRAIGDGMVIKVGKRDFAKIDSSK
jgi:tyrosyl-tRNA synthetase